MSHAPKNNSNHLDSLSLSLSHQESSTISYVPQSHVNHFVTSKEYSGTLSGAHGITE